MIAVGKFAKKKYLEIFLTIDVFCYILVKFLYTILSFLYKNNDIIGARLFERFALFLQMITITHKLQ